MFTEEEALQELAKVSAYADRIDLVQGGGGNTSAKIQGGAMVTKASGFRLREVMQGRATTRVDLGILVKAGTGPEYKYPTSKELEDWDRSCMISRSVLRPSIELSLHALLDAVVLHTHPVAANAFLCVEESRKYIEDLFEERMEFLLLPYAKPGIDIGIELMNNLRTRRGTPRPSPRVILLENHGVVVHGKSAEEVIAVHDSVLKICSGHLPDSLGSREFRLLDPEDYVDLNILKAIRSSAPEFPHLVCISSGREKTAGQVPKKSSGTLFPDVAVYCGADALEINSVDPSTFSNLVSVYVEEYSHLPRVWRIGQVSICMGRNLSDALSVAEVWWAHEIVEFLARGLGTPRYLSPQRVRELLKWEAESYRKAVAAREDE